MSMFPGTEINNYKKHTKILDLTVNISKAIKQHATRYTQFLFYIWQLSKFKVNVNKSTHKKNTVIKNDILKMKVTLYLF